MTIHVEVVYALPAEQVIVPLELGEGASVQDALAASRIFESHPDIDRQACSFGVWGRKVEPGQVLRDRDRVEIYRPLVADPKQARRARAQAGRGKVR